MKPKTPNITQKIPDAYELEEAVIGACLVEKDGYIRISETVKAHHFSSLSHRSIYEAITELFKQSQVVDLLTVADQMHKAGTLEAAGGPFALVECTNKVASSAHIEAHARIIVQQWMRRDAIALSSEILKGAFDPTEDIIDTLNSSEMRLDDIKNAMQSGQVQTNEEILHDVMSAMDKAKLGIKGLNLFGVHSLDSLLDGLEEDLVIVAGRPGMGKSSLVNSALKHCILNDIPVLAWSMEMSNKSTMMRLLSACTEIPFKRLRMRDITQEEESLVMEWADRIAKSNVVMEQMSSISILDIKSRAMSLKRKHGIKAVFIDRLELLNDLPGVGKDNKSSRVGANTKMMRQMAQNLGIPIICLCQLNRAVEGRTSKIPTLADLRESGDIEQDATKIIFLYRPEYYEPKDQPIDPDLVGKAFAVLAKNTNGETGQAECKFIGDCMVFHSEGKEDDTPAFSPLTPSHDDFIPF